MTASHSLQERALAARELFSIADAAGVRIRCVSGSVWVTLDDDPRDIVLEAGDEFTGAQRRRALVYAFTDAMLALGPVGETAQPRARAAVPSRPQGRTVVQVPV